MHAVFQCSSVGGKELSSSCGHVWKELVEEVDMWKLLPRLPTPSASMKAGGVKLYLQISLS